MGDTCEIAGYRGDEDPPLLFVDKKTDGGICPEVLGRVIGIEREHD